MSLYVLIENSWLCVVEIISKKDWTYGKIRIRVSYYLSKEIYNLSKKKKKYTINHF